MAVSLFKLAMSATTTTVADPTALRYLYRATATLSAANLFIARSKFFNDAGNALTANFTTATASNGYYMLYINGVVQQSGLYSVGAAGTGVTITASVGSSIPSGEPVVLVVTNFAPTSSTTVTG